MVNKMKRINSPVTSPNQNVKRTKSIDRRPDKDEGNFENEFEAPSDRLSVKTESCVPEVMSTSHQMAYLTDNHVFNDAEKVVNPTVWPSAVMMKKSSNFEADLKLIDEKFGKIRRRKAGMFILLLPDTNDMRRELISFLEANNIRYLTPKKIRVVIEGLPCDTSTQQIKEELVEKDLEVEEVFKRLDRRTKKPLPLFYAVLPKSDRNESIFNLTNLLNFNISVGGRCEVVGRSRKIRKIREKMKAKPKADVPKYFKTGQVGTSNAKTVQAEIFRNQKKDRKLGLRMNINMVESGPATDFEDIIYIMQEFRKLFGKFDAKTFAQQYRNATTSIEKFHLFSTVLLD